MIATNHNTVFGRLARWLWALALVIPTMLLAQEQTDEKGIRIRDQSRELNVSIEASKDIYQVGEAIRFKVKGNQRFYLYLFNVNRDDNTSVMLLPNSKQKNNRFDANRVFTVPTNVEFYADAPGTEEILLVANPKPLNFDTSRYQKSGDFLEGDAETLDNQVKALRIRTRQEENREPVVKQLQLVIKDKGARGIGIPGGDDGSHSKPIVFVSADQSSYGLGEDVRMVFGASQPGWVHLYAVEPQGRRSLLKSQQVSGEKVYRLTARAERPIGEHALVAIYGDDEKAREKVLDLLDQDSSPKGLRLVEEEGPVAVYRFQIHE
jgi:hypothetical protein